MHADATAALRSRAASPLREGLPNLQKHLENVARFGLPCVVAINRFATDAQEEIDVLAAEARAAGAFDAVVCDLLMPEMGGVDFWGELGRRAPALAARTVFVTGAGLGEDLRGTMEGFQGPIVEKPFTASDLRAAGAAVLAP